MYLSRLTLNPRDRGVLRDLNSPNDMHKTLWRAFPGEANGGPGRNLFRVEPTSADDESPPTVLVQSEHQPDWTVLPANYLMDRQVTPLKFATELANQADGIRFAPGDCFRFRVLANPTKKVAGQRHGLFDEKDQREWLSRKAEAGGFQVAPQSLVLVPIGRLPSGNIGQGQRAWFGVRFDGVLRVVDPHSFITTLTQGIGPAKAFGFGLLSISRR